MKADYSCDAQLEAKFDQLKVVEPALFCVSNRKVINICVNPTCKTSLSCNQSECKECSYHKTCPCVPFQLITNLINDRAGIFKQFVTRTFNIESDCMEELKYNRNRLTDHLHLGGTQGGYQILVEEIYQKGNVQGVSGKDAKQFYEWLKKDKEEKNKEASGLFEEYQKLLREGVERMKQIQEKLFKGGHEHEDTSFIMAQQGQKTHQKKMKKFIKSIDSKILTVADIKSNNNIQFLWHSLNKPFELQLIFRGSQHKFNAKSFHSKCDHIHDTFTLVRTQFGKTVGGFCHYSWSGEEANQFDWVHDPGCRAFLMSFDLQLRMFPEESGKCLIQCDPSWGPKFGLGDLWISDECNKNNRSRAIMPNIYNRGDGQKDRKVQQGWKAFSGSPEGHNFRILQYEVFQVIMKKQTCLIF